MAAADSPPDAEPIGLGYESAASIRQRMMRRLREHIAASGDREALELFDKLFGRV